ncbi:MAG: tRNA (adenosine(37)-N6)-dimethylallyltransferase MiaA [Cyclobacteriaceae bacterium]
MKKKLVVIAGPTGSGKTAFAIRLAQLLHTEIVSADSRQVFREMKIGTAQPTAEELKKVPHHLVGHRTILEDYNASIYATEANESLNQIFEKKDIAVLCGGSGLYIRALIEGLDDLPEVPAEIRNNLQQEFKTNGLSWLQEEAEKTDPEWFQKIDRQNHRRLLRCVEIYRSSGKKISELQQTSRSLPNWDIIKIGLDLPRPLLYQRIDTRVEEMVDAGLVQEATDLYPHRQLRALHTVGYTEMFRHLNQEISLEEAIGQIKQHSRNYAKRQMTWFRKENGLIWINPQSIAGESELESLILGNSAR